MKASAILCLVGSAFAAPIFQAQVEALRQGGMSERDILLTLHANHPSPAYTGSPLYAETATSTVYDFIDRDTEGDISPGSGLSFDFAKAKVGARILGFLEGLMAARDGRGAGEGDMGDNGRPAWRFKWMGGAWSSAASRVARLQG